MDAEKSQVLSQEVENLAAKEVIQLVADDREGYISPLFLVPKSDGSWCQVINLKSLSSAPYTFSKLIKPVVSTLRKLGIRSILYLDDTLIMARSKEEARRHLATAMELLVALGFIINLKKSTLSPTQELEFLGFLLNSHSMTIVLPVHEHHAVKNMV